MKKEKKKIERSKIGKRRKRENKDDKKKWNEMRRIKIEEQRDKLKERKKKMGKRKGVESIGRECCFNGAAQCFYAEIFGAT